MSTEEATTEQVINDQEVIGENDVISTKINDLTNRIEEIVRSLKNIATETKTIRKEAAKLEKKKGRARKPRAKRSATGFALPVPISDDLSEFLGLAKGTMISRTEVLNNIHEYIKKHNLQLPTDRRKINLELEGGERLQKLLGVATNQPLSYFNLQTYLKKHFTKVKDAAPAVPAEPPKDVKTKTQEALREAEVPADPVKKTTKIIRKKVNAQEA